MPLSISSGQPPDALPETLKLSVVVPVYNMEATLEECLTSILKQTFRDFEVIVVDDGSTDNSPVICASMLSQDTRMRYFRQDNKGLSGARNTGIALSKGQYITFVDSDDSIDPEFYFSAFESESREFDLFMVGVDRFEGEIKLQTTTVFASSREQLHELILTTNYFGLGVWSKIFRADIIKNQQIAFRDILFAEDLLFMAEYLPFVEKSYVNPKPMYRYRIMPDSMTNNARTNRVIGKRDLDILESLRLANDVFSASADPWVTSCFNVRLARSSLRLLGLCARARFYDQKVMSEIHNNIRSGFRDFLASKHQKAVLKLAALPFFLMPRKLFLGLFKVASRSRTSGDH
jgi:glycosyltransferase involved in cell wall biosynthesis